MLDALGNIGDLLGGIGVVVTLAYLAVQIQRNTRAVRASAFDSISVSMTEAMEKIAQDPELTRIWFAGHHGIGELSPVDEQRYFLLLLSLVRRWENAFIQSRSGTLGRESWEGMKPSLERSFSEPGAQGRWPAMRDLLDPEFARYVDEVVKSDRSE